MAPKLSGQTSTFGSVFFVSKSLSELKARKLMAILTRTPRIDVRMLIYQTWPIVIAVLSSYHKLLSSSQVSAITIHVRKKDGGCTFYHNALRA